MEAFFCLKDDFFKKLGSCASDDDVVSHFSGCVMVPLLLLLLLVPPTVGEVGWGGEVRWRCSKSVSRETEREFGGKSEEREGESRQQTKKRSRQSVERRTSLTSNVKNVEIKTTQRNCLFMIRSRSDRLFESL